MMMKCFVVGVFALSCVAGVAQQKPTSAAEAALPWVAAEAPEVQRLALALSGKWKTAEKFEANEFLKNGATGSGVFSIRKGPGGNSLKLDYSSASSMGPYSSTRIIYWDGRSGFYRAFYCDSLQPAGCSEAGTGKWEGKDLVFESTTDGPNGPIQMKQRFSDISSGGFTFSLDVINEGKSKRSLTIQARRSGARS
jgi:hypothetical protein